MVKNRLIPCVITKGNIVVQSVGFKRYLPIGRLRSVIEFLTNWDVDEIVILDIDAASEGRTIDLELIDQVAQHCMVPLTIGGGIKNPDFVPQLLRVGAEKMCINTIAFENPEFISTVSKKYGSQFVTVSVDAKLTKYGHQTYIRNGQVPVGEHPAVSAKRMESLGAGEIFLNSIDRDGSKLGYDIGLLQTVSDAVKIPVIACGGVGKASHLADAILEGRCQAAAASNIFYHTELSTIVGKAIMKHKGLPIRIDTDVQYNDFSFDYLDRPV